LVQVDAESALYHETLHVKHPTHRSGSTLLPDSPKFLAEEKLSSDFARARRFLDHLSR